LAWPPRPKADPSALEGCSYHPALVAPLSGSEDTMGTAGAAAAGHDHRALPSGSHPHPGSVPWMAGQADHPRCAKSAPHASHCRRGPGQLRDPPAASH